MAVFIFTTKDNTSVRTHGNTNVRSDDSDGRPKPLSAVMYLKVSRLLGGTPEFWMRLQAVYALKKAEQNKKVMEGVARIVPAKPVEEVRA